MQAHGPCRFQALREKFDQVSAVRSVHPCIHYPDTLPFLKRLQHRFTTNTNATSTSQILGYGNCSRRTSTYLPCLFPVVDESLGYLVTPSLLLDAISIAVPATPSLIHLIRPSPTSTSSSMPITSYTHPPPSHPQSVPMNGHGYDHANGRYRDRPREYGRSEVCCNLCCFVPSFY